MVSQGKRKRRQREQNFNLSKRISFARFNLYTLGTRFSMARVMAEELSFWADENEKLIGFVFRDTTDDDFGWQILARDRVGRFRCVKVEASLKNESYATVGLRIAIAETLRNDDISALGIQGDEPNTPTDVLRVPEGSDPSKFHPYFRELYERPGRVPARAVVREIGPWLAPADPHFVKEFQFQQFDQRLWELYLWACFRELGFDIEQPEAPDFICSAPGIEFAVEATTVAPSQSGPLASHPEPSTKEEMERFLADYMPMKFGTPLTNKLNKVDKEGLHYWERDGTKDKPFVIAVADFHKQAERHRLGSMTYTQSALWPYLYGHRVEWKMVEGVLNTSPVKNPTHKYGTKEVPSGFFDLPGAENISAVLFSNAGTLAKFDRMGVAAGFPAPKHRYFRVGSRFNPDPNATIGLPFNEDVSDPNYQEGWSDELQIFHNPNARIPLSHDWLSGLTQFYFDPNGEQISIIPDHHVWWSNTLLV